jgi:hypothetical protein
MPILISIGGARLVQPGTESKENAATVAGKEEAKMKRKKLQRRENMAASLNYQLVPQP